MRGLLEKTFLSRPKHENTGLEPESMIQKKTRVINMTWANIAQHCTAEFFISPLQHLSGLAPDHVQNRKWLG
jgi:hypothetical protein